jgi:uncharacterized protein involved in type VI secretion and phage assembly
MMAGIPQMMAEEASTPPLGRILGVVIATVTNNSGDPDGLGRVKVKFPWLSAANESFWARIATPMAGNDRGMFFLPEVDDEVLVVFERGDLRFPFIIGALWNGKDKAPAANTDGKNNLRMIKSRSGHVIRLNDEKGKETIEIVDCAGRNSIVIDTANDTITITSGKDIVLAAPKGAVKVAAKTIEMEASGPAKIKAGEGMDVTAGKVLNVAGSTVNIN